MSDQLDLFSRPVPYVRGSETSRMAAVAKVPTADSDLAKVVTYIRHGGWAGRTDDEGLLAKVVGENSYRARRIEAVRAGLVVGHPSLRRLTHTKRLATVWCAREFVR